MSEFTKNLTRQKLNRWYFLNLIFLLDLLRIALTNDINSSSIELELYNVI